jgi:hypothetical protein
LYLLAVADLQTVLSVKLLVVVHGLEIVFAGLLTIIVRDRTDEKIVIDCSQLFTILLQKLFIDGLFRIKSSTLWPFNGLHQLH